MINIVLFEPEIPQNTGNIGRLCVCNNARLHLIKPLGFSLDESKLKRAGMDYWQYLDLHIHESWEDFLKAENPNPQHLFFISTKATKTVYQTRFVDGDYIVFGKESAGLPKHFYEDYRDQLRLIPMLGEHSRSLNLANSVSIVFYESLRQVHHFSETTDN